MRVRIGTMDELKRQRTLKFSYREEGIQRDGFAAWHEGRVVAYENACRHIPIPLDYDDNRFFAPDGKHFVCQTHGALYDAGTGRCVRGPCGGASLKCLETQLVGEEIWVDAAD